MGCCSSKSVATHGGGLRMKPAYASHTSREKGAADAAPLQHFAPDDEAQPVGRVGLGRSEEGVRLPTANDTQRESAQSFLVSVLESTERFIQRLPDSAAVKQVVALTFMNSCVEVTRTKFRLKMDDIVALVRELTSAPVSLPLLQSTLTLVEERSMDDGFSRMLLAWYTHNPSFDKRISAEACQALLDVMYVRTTVNKPARFDDVLDYVFRWISLNQATLELFSKFTDGQECMTTEQLGKFLRDTQRIEVTERQLTEKYKFRFGGGIHRYNFASHNGSVLTNNIIDPTRTSDVWQDMTQAFTHYAIACMRIGCEADVRRALAEGARALVLDVATATTTDEPMCGTCTLQTVLDVVKKSGFVLNTYPIVLCLSPGACMPLATQDRVAQMLTDTFGSMLAKGLMFEGAAISDPKFSPGALRKKVLIMSAQAPLKPFIGFLVADMIKDGLGVRVTNVVENTPAAKSGVQKDDWLTHINDHPIMNKQHLRQHLAHLKVGEEFTLKRENLDELKVVVGGVVDASDSSVSALLSNLTFLRYTAATLTSAGAVDAGRCNGNASNGCAAGGGGGGDGHGSNSKGDGTAASKTHRHHVHAPLDTSNVKNGGGACSSTSNAGTVTGEHGDRHTSTAAVSKELRPWDVLRVDAAALPRASLTREVLNTHFAMVRLDSGDGRGAGGDDDDCSNHHNSRNNGKPQRTTDAVAARDCPRVSGSDAGVAGDGGVGVAVHAHVKRDVKRNGNVAAPAATTATPGSTVAVGAAPDYAGMATQLGVQFVDIDNSNPCLAWLRGRFYDNGRCGYLLKSDLDTERISDLTITILSGPRALACPPLMRASVSLHGAGTARTSGAQMTFTDCNETTVAVVKMSFEVDGAEYSFAAAFSLSTVRTGYRAMPCIPAGQEDALHKIVHGVYCFVKQL